MRKRTAVSVVEESQLLRGEPEKAGLALAAGLAHFRKTASAVDGALADASVMRKLETSSAERHASRAR